MKNRTHSRLQRTMRAVALPALLLIGLTARAADLPPAGPANCAAHQGEMQQHMQQHQQKRLTQLAQALKLQPAQQAAWRAYVQAEQAIPPAPHCPSETASALELAQARSEHARLMAEHLAASSKTLATLWQQLSPEQRQTFNQLAHESMRHHGMMDRPHGDQPPMPQ